MCTSILALFVIVFTAISPLQFRLHVLKHETQDKNFLYKLIRASLSTMDRIYNYIRKTNTTIA
ncbi:hypothetical protein T10_7331 [Trichinella papuae]|uniref:Uncharacterized protein n=1 Tax=Trichinella papuae TaxID=268474 RepID=A0A0V1NBC5_9BILA|nr:hypothetical protein T10_7331 [Trichinella papuae]